MLGTRLGKDGDFLRVAFPLTPLPCWPLGHFGQPVRSLSLRFQFHAVMLLDFKSPEENEISFQMPVSHTPASYLRPRRDRNPTMPSACPPRPRDFSLAYGQSALWPPNPPSRSHMGFSRLLAASAHFYLPFFVRLIPLRVCRYINP